MAGITRYDARRALTRFGGQAKALGGALTVMWGALAANALAAGALFSYGIVPRTLTGLRGILFAPFIHGSVEHLLSNSVPFAVLGWLVLTRGRRRFIGVTLAAMLGAGLSAWLLGAPGSVHVGASGVIFGYLGYLMLNGWYERRLIPILMSVDVTALWGGVAFGVLPGQPGVSWQAHLGGFVAGLWAAKRLHRTEAFR